jgi:eukaryotic-like serine/threonine-protein kinase
MDPVVLSESDPLRPAADSFVSRLRRGDRPTLAEYTERFPDQANRIRELFPKLLAAERKAGDKGATGPYGLVDASHGIPKTIGDFQIVREIGRGGMGIVYEAVQESLSRQVALKVLPAGPFSRGPYLERFYREARAAGRLHHTNIVPVFGVGQADGVHYYAMQYIEGMGLDAVVKEIRQRRGLPANNNTNDTQSINRQLRAQAGIERVGDFELGPASILPAVDADSSEVSAVSKNLADLATSTGPPYFRSIARLGVQVAEALAYAHDQNVLHRDVKPSNLLLDKHGILWITDFGLAKADGDDLSGPDDIVGTLRYMAPERFKAKSHARSDIYALGMTLYEMVALHPAFDDEDRFQLVQRINAERPRKLHVIDPTVPRDLETIILKSIQRDAIHRYATAAEMADDLRLFLADRPIAARRASRLEELRRWCRRNPIVAALAGMVTVMGFVLAAVVFRAYVSIRHERDQVEFQKLKLESTEAEAKDQLWTSQVNFARLQRSLHAVGQRFVALDALTAAQRIRSEDRLAIYAAASLALPDVRRVNNWGGWPDGTVAVHLDPSFERYARSDGQGAISIRNTIDDGEIAKLPGLGGPAFPRFGNTGAFLAARHERDGHLVVWRVGGDANVKVIDEPANVAAIAFGPDDRVFACGHIDGSVATYDLPSGRARGTFSAGSTAVSISFRPNSQEVAVATERDVAIFDTDSGQVRMRFDVPGSAARVAWHPDGRHLAVGTDNGRIRIYRRPGAEPTLVLENASEGPPELQFHPDGSLLVSTSADRMIRLWCPYNGRLLLATPANVSQPRFTKDGRQYGPEIEGNRLHMLELASGRECRTLTPSLNGTIVFHDGSVSPDSRLLAVGTANGVIVWDMATGEELTRLPLGDTAGCLFLNNSELLTSGSRGVFSWPVHVGNTGASIGPPRQLAAWPAERLGRSADGSVVAVATKVQGAVVLDRERPTIRNTLLAHEAAAFLSVSSDGKLIATGTQGGRNVRIWDAITNRLIRELEINAGSVAAFSPDGRWLATDQSGSGVQIWSTSDWQPKHTVAADRQSRIAFSPTQKLVAVESGSGSIRLFDPETGKLQAELEDPDHARASWLTFSPDGSRVIAASNDIHAVRVWDLAALRRGITTYGMAWSIPPLTVAVVSQPVAEARVVGSDLLDPVAQSRWSIIAATLGATARPNDADVFVRRGAAFADLGFDGLAMNDYGTALRLRPDHAEAAFLRASEYYRLRQWEPAFEDFTRALDRPALGDLARWMRGKSLLQLDRVEEMMTEVNGLLQHYPDDPQLYYQRALGEAYRKDYVAAVADLEIALRKGPSHDQALNNLAWILVTGPLETRDPDRALGLAQRAVRLAPTKATYQNTLSVCLYRLGRYREALSALDKSQLYGRGQFDGYDFYVMAMCLAKLDENDKCRQCLSRARDWQKNTRLTPHEAFELERFRTEAEELVGEPNGK